MSELRTVLKELGLEGQRFGLAQRRGGQLVPCCFNTVEGAEAWLLEEGDAYICGNPLRAGFAGKPSNQDVIGEGVLLIDCDPKKCPEKDPDGTTTERRDAAWDTAMAIWEGFGQAGILVDSGRGAQVWLRVEPGIPRARLRAWIQDTYRHELVEIDATHDVSRLMRLPGTINSRTGDPVVLVDPGHGRLSRAEVAETLEGWAESVTVEVPESDRSEPSRIEVRRYVHGDALAMWREDPMEITSDRSKRDLRFLIAVLSNGAPLTAASRLLYALPGSKAATRGDENYWRSVATSAAKIVGTRAEERKTLDGLIDAARQNGEVLTAPNSVKAMGRLRCEDFAGWAALRAQIKPLARAAGISIADVDLLVKAEARRITDVQSSPPDEVLIYCRSDIGGKGTWKARSEDGSWSWVGITEARAALSAEPDPESALRLALANPFGVALEPFKARILPGRTWNESNARFVVEPKEGPHPTWDQLYRVVGRGLDGDLSGSAWAQRNKIATGGEYLFAWTASMLQDPKSRRAYLALFSPEQGTGKSTFFEAHKLLMGSAVVKANKALTNPQFNGELAGGVLCYTEEVDLGAGGRATLYNKVKDLTLGDTVSLEAKGAQAFEVPNVLSWGQASNSQSYCPVFDGDDRVTLFQVLPPEGDERMAKDEFRRRLREEAPAFLFTLLNAALPAPEGRYVVPPIMTEAKAQQARANRNDLEDWTAENPGWVLLPEGEVVSAFRAHLELAGLPVRFWTPQRIRRELPYREARAQELWQRAKSDEWTLTATEVKERYGLRASAKDVGAMLATLARATDRLSRVAITGATRWRLVTNP